MKRSGTSGTVSSSSRESIALREEAAARASRSCPAAEETAQNHRVVYGKTDARSDVDIQMELRNRGHMAAGGLANDEPSGQPVDMSVITSLMAEYEREHERLKDLIMQPAAARRPRRTAERRLGMYKHPFCPAKKLLLLEKIPLAK
jgi:hypothetical protein